MRTVGKQGVRIDRVMLPRRPFELDAKAGKARELLNFCPQGMATERALCRNKLVLDHTVNVRIGKQWGNPTKLQ